MRLLCYILFAFFINTLVHAENAVPFYPSSATASQEQVEKEIENSFAGTGLQDHYHSPWGEGTTMPVIMTYFFEEQATLDSLVYVPRDNTYWGNDWGNFKEVEVWYSQTSNPGEIDFTLHDTYNFQGKAESSSVTFPEGLVNPTAIKFVVNSANLKFNGFPAVNCGEMQFWTSALFDVYEQIMSKAQNVQWEEFTDMTALANEANSYNSSIDGSGKWIDIDYSSTSQSSWSPYTHLNRLKTMVVAYTRNGSSLKGSSTLYTNIINALNYWYSADPRSTNWWYQQIACPQAVGEILIMMRSGSQQVPSALETNLLDRMAAIGGSPDQGGSQGTGANKIDIATHWLYRACLLMDANMLTFATDQAYSPLHFTTGEGFQYDYSYQQHGPQLYIGGYGLVLIDKLSKVAWYTIGTGYDMPQAKMDMLSEYTRNTYLSVIRGQYFHFDVLGRGVSRPGSLSQIGFADVLERVKLVDAGYTLEYDHAIARLRGEEAASYNVTTKNKHFWNSDYTLHSQSGYSFDVRSVSTRTYRNENGNGENLKGYFLADGATNISVDGDEYVNIFPVWDWTMIPGVTAPAINSIPQPAEWGTYGTSDFAGGVSDGLNGISTYSYYDTYSNINTGANKSWFFLDDKIVCLGAGVSSTNSSKIRTTVNQCLLSGDVVAITNGSQSILSGGSHSYSGNLDRVFHDKVGYIFPSGGNVTITNQAETGNWASINQYYSTQNISENVFKLYLDHGTTPSAGTYQYIVVPNITSADELNQLSINNIEVVANTAEFQVVRQVAEDRWYFVFFESATFQNNDFSIQVDKPCTFILDQPQATEINVLVSCPSQNVSTLKMIGTFPSLSGAKQLTCSFPVYPDPYAGKTKEFVFNASTADHDGSSSGSTAINVLEDAYVRDGSNGGTNYGTDHNLVIKTDGVGWTREVYLKFDLSTVSVSELEKATLDLEVLNANADVSLTNWEFWYVTDDSWNESTITYNTAPEGTNVISTIQGVQESTEGGPDSVTVDITDIILNNITSEDKMLSIMIRSTSTGGATDAQFYSKENVAQRGARLNITTKISTDIDEPVNIDVNPENIKVEVYDIMGRYLQQGTKDQFSTTQLKDGIYLIVETFTHNKRLHRECYKVYIKNGLN